MKKYNESLIIYYIEGLFIFKIRYSLFIGCIKVFVVVFILICCISLK